MDTGIALTIGALLAPVAFTGPGAPCQAPGCQNRIPDLTPSGRRTRDDAETCGVICRKRRHRWLKGVGVDTSRRSPTVPSRVDGPETSRRFAYADPPYPGKSGIYRDHDDYAGEVDHSALIARLEAEHPDGWALSTSARALQAVLSQCPRSARVCVWRRPPRHAASSRPVNAWEPLIVVGGRPYPTDVVQDRLDVLDYRGRYSSLPGALTGMKAPQFARWVFDQLNAQPCDELIDLFPGSNAIGEAWAAYTSRPAAAPRDASAAALERLNAELDVAIEQRVELHRARKAGLITVAYYLAGLKEVRDLEDELEPRRRELGAGTSRAYELVKLEERLVPAHTARTVRTPAGALAA